MTKTKLNNEFINIIINDEHFRIFLAEKAAMAAGTFATLAPEQWEQYVTALENAPTPIDLSKCESRLLFIRCLKAALPAIKELLVAFRPMT